MPAFIHLRDEALIDLPNASDALRELAARGVRHVYAKSRLLIEQGDMAGPIYIVLSGRLRVYSKDIERGREITFGSYGPGQYVGEMSLDGGPRSANVEAETRCECALVTRQTLQAFIAERPEFAFELLTKVIAVARVATQTMRNLALADTGFRLRLRLEELARPGPDGGRVITPPPTQRELANSIGCDKSMVTRLLQSLERAGLLERQDRRWRMLGPPPPAA